MRGRWVGSVGACALLLGFAVGCPGQLGDAFGPAPGSDAAHASAVERAPEAGLRRLSRLEMDLTLKDLLGDETFSAFALLPEDYADPFDNDYTTQRASGPLIDGLERLAEGTAARALSTPEGRAALLPCDPVGPDDAACLGAFIEAFGRRVFRRPLTDAEVARHLGLLAFAVEDNPYVDNDFYTAVDLVIRAMIQSPHFVYRVEVGTPVPDQPGVHRLDEFEIATRMAFFLWGRAPDDALLDDAAEGRLGDPDSRRAVARRMMDDPRARARVERFHALWLGYHQLPHASDLNDAFRRESGALLEQVIFEERRPYFDVFTATGSFLDDRLAVHYDLPPPGSDDLVWTGYGNSGRKGLLSHGSVLSAFSKFNDTSPTQRGIFVRTRLLCDRIEPPPPNVNADEPPTSVDGDCKIDRYAIHRDNPGCASCHDLVDPIGFGLENYDRAGRFRAHDDGAPECIIEGRGELVEIGPFEGPAGLADLIVESGRLEACLVRQVWRFAVGRPESRADQRTIGALASAFAESGHAFDGLMVELVADPAFAYRREE